MERNETRRDELKELFGDDYDTFFTEELSVNVVIVIVFLWLGERENNFQWN